MKTAIDCYARGKQKEASADDYNRNLSYFAGRFICPECGELVHLTGSKYSNHFAHYKKSELSADCDRRVDGVSTQSIYEKMGLPIYLRKDSNGNFNIFLGFRTIPRVILEKATQMKLSISFDNSDKKYYISPERFKFGETTLIPLSYIPKNQGKYRLKYEPAKYASNLLKYWSDESDGFSFEGALFSVTDIGGKKIRHGDNVFTEVDYYWVRKQNELPRYIAGIEMKKSGVLVLDNGKYNIFRGRFSSSISDIAFERLTNYLRESLKVNLLEKEPTIVPVWPPCVKSEDGYIVKESAKECFGRVQSGNDIPKMYVYSGINVTPDAKYVDDSLVKVPLYSDLTYINIDRKYVSGGVTFLKNNLRMKGKEIVITCNDSALPNGITHIDGDIENTSLRFSFPIQLNILILYSDGNLDYIKKKEELLVPSLNRIDKIIIDGNNYVWEIISIDHRDIQSKIISENVFIKLMNMYQNTPKVTIPSWCRDLILSSYSTSPRIRKLLLTNEISIPLLNLLEEKNYE